MQSKSKRKKPTFLQVKKNKLDLIIYEQLHWCLTEKKTRTKRTDNNPNRIVVSNGNTVGNWSVVFIRSYTNRNAVIPAHTVCTVLSSHATSTRTNGNAPVSHTRLSSVRHRFECRRALRFAYGTLSRNTLGAAFYGSGFRMKYLKTRKTH